MKLRIIAPRARGYYRDTYENYGSDVVTGQEWVFTRWEDSVTEQADRRADVLIGRVNLPNGLPKLNGAKSEKDREMSDWYRRKAEEHREYMISVLGTPRSEQEAELAVRNHGALADGRALEL